MRPDQQPIKNAVTDDTEVYHQEGGINTKTLGAQWHAYMVTKGLGNDKNHEHTQSDLATSWIINHNMGKRPHVTVIDTDGDVVDADLVYTDSNNLTINFSTATAGVAYLN